MSAEILYRCLECNAPLTKNYDHVGDCGGGDCSGTFNHPIDDRALARSRTCSLRFKDVPHRGVRKEYR